MFESIGSFITNPIVAGIIGGTVIILMAYADSKYRDIKRERQTYIQLFFLSMIVVSSVTYFALSYSNTTDEFLEQTYETVVPSSIKLPKRKVGGSILKGRSQPTMKPPSSNVLDMFSKLPTPGTLSNVEISCS